MMRTEDAEKIVAVTAAAGLLFAGLLVFRILKGAVLLAQVAQQRGQEARGTGRDTDKS